MTSELSADHSMGSCYHEHLLSLQKTAVKWLNWIWILLDQRQQKLWEITELVISFFKKIKQSNENIFCYLLRQNHVEMKMSIQSKEKPWDQKLKAIWNQAAEQFPLHYISTTLSSHHCLKKRTLMKKTQRYKITLLSFKQPWILTLLAYLELLCAFLSVIP